MNAVNLSVEAAAVIGGAWLVRSGEPALGVLWLVAGVGIVILHERSGGGREDS